MFPYPLNVILCFSGSAVGFSMFIAVFIFLTWKGRPLPTWQQFNQAFQRKWWFHSGMALMLSLLVAGVGHKVMLIDMVIGLVILLHLGMMVWYLVRPRPTHV